MSSVNAAGVASALEREAASAASQGVGGTIKSGLTSAYNFLIGDDIAAIRDPNKSTLEKVMALGSLALNFVAPELKVGGIAAKLGLKVAEEAVEKGAVKVGEAAVGAGVHAAENAAVKTAEHTAEKVGAEAAEKTGAAAAKKEPTLEDWANLLFGTPEERAAAQQKQQQQRQTQGAQAHVQRVFAKGVDNSAMRNAMVQSINQNSSAWQQDAAKMNISV